MVALLVVNGTALTSLPEEETVAGLHIAVITELGESFCGGLQRHDAVAEVAAIGVDDDDYGKRLKAFVALKDGQDVSEDDLKEHVKAYLARWA